MKTAIKLPEQRSQYRNLHDYIKEMIVQSKDDIRAWNTPINDHEWDESHITVLTVEQHASDASKVSTTFTITVGGQTITAKLHYGKCDISGIIDDLTDYSVDEPYELDGNFNQEKLDELFTTVEDTDKGLFRQNAILAGLLSSTHNGLSTGNALGEQRELLVPLLSDALTSVNDEEVIKLKANLQSKMIHGVAKLPVLTRFDDGFLDGFGGIVDTGGGDHIDGSGHFREEFLPHRDSGVMDATIERLANGNMVLNTLTVKETRDTDESRYNITVNGKEVVPNFPGSGHNVNASNTFGPVKEGEHTYRIENIIDLSAVGGLQEGAEIIIGMHSRIEGYGYGEYTRLVMRYTNGNITRERTIQDENASDGTPFVRPNYNHPPESPDGGDDSEGGDRGGETIFPERPLGPGGETGESDVSYIPVPDYFTVNPSLGGYD